MHEILETLDAHSVVLDLGCNTGSFPQSATAARVVRLDYKIPAGRPDGAFIQADAAHLPFPDHNFAAVISNHSLEHIDDLDGALSELGRVIHRSGSLFVAVPDASTFTDKLYRWLTRGGGHVNPFTSAEELASHIEQATGLRHVATKLLYSSLAFLNARNATGPRPRRWKLVGGGTEWSLRAYTFLSRRLDRRFGTRTSIYGWAFYFGNFSAPIDTIPWPNVCIRCGSGSPVNYLIQQNRIRSADGMFPVFDCPACGTRNSFLRCSV